MAISVRPLTDFLLKTTAAALALEQLDVLGMRREALLQIPKEDYIVTDRDKCALNRLVFWPPVGRSAVAVAHYALVPATYQFLARVTLALASCQPSAHALAKYLGE
jgi:hypothetical protein